MQRAIFNILPSETNQSKAIVSLEGNLDINQAGFLKLKFEDLLDNWKEIEINGTEISYVDISFVQLFLAFRKEAASRQIKLSYHFDFEDDILTLLEHAAIDLKANN